MRNKKILLMGLVMLILTLILVAVVALGQMNSEETPTTTEDTTESVSGDRFDFKYEPNRKNLPDRETAQQVVEGMSVSEVYAIMGNPQRDIGSGTVVLEWNLNSGEVLTVSFGLNLELDDWIVVQNSIA